MLKEAEKQLLFTVVGSNPGWQTAYCAALLTGNTTMRPCEIKRLFCRDLDPINRVVTVRQRKTEAGVRSVPVNEEAWSAFAALKLHEDAPGNYGPEHYIFFRRSPK